MVDATTENLMQTAIDSLVLNARVEADSLAQLYDLYYERIFRFCLRRLFSREIAEDVTSTVFLDVARTIGSFAGRDEADFRSWIFAIAMNKTNAYIRKTSRRKRILADFAESMVDKTQSNVDQSWPDVYQTILKLNTQEQTIVTLRFFEEFSFQQIAGIFDSKPSTVRVTLHRALKKLKKHLSPPADSEM